MNESNLPVPKEEKAPALLTEYRPKFLSRSLLAGGVLSIFGALAIFFLAHHLLLSVALFVVGLALFGTQQLVKKSLALTTSPQTLLSSTDDRLELIRRAVNKAKFLSKLEKEGSLLAAQADLLSLQYKNLKQILNQKFDKTEITYDRYLAAIENGCLAIAENLQLNKLALENLNLTDPNSSGYLSKKENFTTNLQTTETAIAELSALYQSLNNVNTKEQYRDQLDSSMEQIRELAKRVQLYSKQ